MASTFGNESLKSGDTQRFSTIIDHSQLFEGRQENQCPLIDYEDVKRAPADDIEHPRELPVVQSTSPAPASHQIQERAVSQKAIKSWA
jgi:hypothetical protein